MENLAYRIFAEWVFIDLTLKFNGIIALYLLEWQERCLIKKLEAQALLQRIFIYDFPSSVFLVIFSPEYLLLWYVLSSHICCYLFKKYRRCQGVAQLQSLKCIRLQHIVMVCVCLVQGVVLLKGMALLEQVWSCQSVCGLVGVGVSL